MVLTQYIINLIIFLLSSLFILCINTNLFALLWQMLCTLLCIFFDWFHICKDLQKVNKYEYQYEYLYYNDSLRLAHQCQNKYESIYVINGVWQSAYVGWYVDCKNTHGANNIKLMNAIHISTNKCKYNKNNVLDFQSFFL